MLIRASEGLHQGFSVNDEFVMGEKFKHIRERNSHTRLVRDEGLLIKPTVDSFAFPNICSIHAIQCP